MITPSFWTMLKQAQEIGYESNDEPLGPDEYLLYAEDNGGGYIGYYPEDTDPFFGRPQVGSLTPTTIQTWNGGVAILGLSTYNGELWVIIPPTGGEIAPSFSLVFDWGTVEGQSPIPIPADKQFVAGQSYRFTLTTNA